LTGSFVAEKAESKDCKTLSLFRRPDFLAEQMSTTRKAIIQQAFYE